MTATPTAPPPGAIQALADWHRAEARHMRDQGGHLAPEPEVADKHEETADALTILAAYRAAIEWSDREDEHTATIRAAHRDIIGMYPQALRMVGNRYSKGSLVELAAWLLFQVEAARTEGHKAGLEAGARHLDERAALVLADSKGSVAHHVAGMFRDSAGKIRAMAPAARAAEGGPMTDATTPGARWRAEGEPDPHGNRYDCERASLPLGNMTDDELANQLYLCDHRRSLASIGLLTAAKDRIRWLSRALAAATPRPGR
jgi:hypothetical protein